MKISDRDTHTTIVFVLTGVAFLVAAVLSRQLWMAIFGNLYSPGRRGWSARNWRPGRAR